MKKPAPRKQLLEALRAALDCPGHFGKVGIVQSKKDIVGGFVLGKDAIAVCGSCVDRMREAIGLEKGEIVPQHYEFDLKLRGLRNDRSTRKN